MPSQYGNKTKTVITGAGDFSVITFQTKIARGTSILWKGHSLYSITNRFEEVRITGGKQFQMAVQMKYSTVSGNMDTSAKSWEGISAKTAMEVHIAALKIVHKIVEANDELAASLGIKPYKEFYEALPKEFAVLKG